MEQSVEFRLANFITLYKRQVSSTVTIYVGQELDVPKSQLVRGFKNCETLDLTFRGRSNYLALYIHKTDTHDLIKLRLSTVRKIVKFLITKKFLLTARRLTWFEKIKLNIRIKKG